MGKRFGAPKQITMLGSKPLFLYSVDAFHSLASINEVVLVTSPDLRGEVEALMARQGTFEKLKIAAGGERRQDSVRNGILASSAKDDDIILVHDAARPLVSHEIIKNVIAAVIESGAALAAIPVTDTLKRVEDDIAKETISRENLWRAQTPQGAKRRDLLAALEHAVTKGITGTDEAELLAQIGVHSKVVVADESNFKITYPGDLERAMRYLART
jgi:2-C-methyl-D-erythritol 4-phosphate cytidylyltransferase